ncbi:hydantoinase B/oxoprolinase family protein [Falsiroseomonas oryzae]|uniref:hydantoinase B/oxoprolinase family protein n=1 Tax=Falsiroseomonas oryzae TaxID=2766473 RepID=UPI0022EA3849|nr:hydantoinase B/oxoprolinase family protein [Roseomonas sp. MO-31]
MTAISPADQAVIGQALLSAAREMGAKLCRSAFSPIVRDAKDASTGLMDATGAAVVQSDELIPVLVGSLSVTLRRCMQAVPPETLREGDFYLTNHPYHGAHHLQDILVFMPAFVDGRIIAYAAAVAHHLDVGGGAPGLNSSATDLYGEGLILPPARWNFARDWQDGNLRTLIGANIRVPDQTLGDIESQFAACFTGIARLRELCARHGTATVEAAMAGQIAYVERRVRAAVAALPDGTYVGEDFVDDDGAGSGPLRVRATVTVAGDSLAVDFAGSAPQVRTHMNAPYASVVSGTLAALKSFLTTDDVPFNEGAARAVTITVPEGTLLNPRFPAPVRARMEATYRAHDAVLKALGAAVPERAVATGFDTTTAFCLSHLQDGRYRVFIELRDGGYGAHAGADGCDAITGPLSNCTNVPVEAIDADHDFFRIEAFALLPGTGGRGQHRGGNGSIRRYRILRDGVRLAIYTDRFRVAAEGLMGGEPGALGGCVIRRGAEKISVRSKDDVVLRAGDVLEMWTGGGGGYGPPDARPDALLAADARLAQEP